MGEVPLPSFDLSGGGSSLLFNTQAETIQSKTIKTSSGTTIVLKPKEDVRQYTVDPKSDESYGIDIARLVAQIEAESPCAVDEKPLTTGNQLWVEKWRPKKYLDLIGNDRTNRRILHWLRQWSPCVFGEEMPEDEDKVVNTDPLKRPSKKILLIHGPPGIGKTSVAHVVAKQCGYSVLEINASDERSGVKIKEKLHNSLFNHTFSGKPTCLIADEIDGSIESGFIRNILDVLNADSKAGYSKKHKSKMITRPIIAICNNLYSSALDKLKPHCEIVSFRPPTERVIKSRLQEILGWEKKEVDMKDLANIVTVANNDIRSCLNMLQFGHTDNSGNKDVKVSWYAVVQDVFNKSVPGVYHKIESSGSADRLVTGCFNIYHEMKYFDDKLKKPNEISEWLWFHEQWTNMNMFRYQNLTPYKFHLLFSDIQNTQHVQSPHRDLEQQRLNSTIIDTMRSCYVTSRNGMVLDFLPYLERILTPDINGIKSQHLKEVITAHVKQVYTQWQISIELRKDVESPYMALSPPFDMVTALDSSRLKDIPTRRAAMLSLLKGKMVLKRKLEDVEENKRDFKEQYGTKVAKEDTRIWVKYNEGFSNAVRKNMTWSNLWEDDLLV